MTWDPELAAAGGACSVEVGPESGEAAVGELGHDGWAIKIGRTIGRNRGARPRRGKILEG